MNNTETDCGDDTKDKDEASGIVRVVKNRDYSVINNTGLRDVRLSFGARGVLAYLLTKPDNWHLRVEDLVRQSPQGEHAVRGMMRELKRYGYLKRERRAGAGGRFEWQTTIYEVPGKGGSSPPVPNASVPDPTPPDPDGQGGKAASDQAKEQARVQNPPQAQPSGDFPQMDKPPVEKPPVEKPPVDKPGVENRPIYKGLSDKKLSEEELSERVSERANARAHSRNVEINSSSKLQPDPRQSPELLALAREFNVNVRRPDARDIAHWADAVATMRDWLSDTAPDAASCELVEAARAFKARWCDGGRRGNPYLSQVVTHWHRFMDDAPTEPSTAPHQTPDGTSQKPAAPKFESAAERRGRDLVESRDSLWQRRAALEEQERLLDELESGGAASERRERAIPGAAPRS